MKHFAPISGLSAFLDRYVATAGYDNQVILWDVATKRAIRRVLHDHLANQCSFNFDGTLLVSASSDHSARIWDVPSMRLKAALLGHSDDVEMAVFSPAGDRVATCSRDFTIRLFDIAGHCLNVLRGHTADVISVSWSADGSTLVSSSDDGTIRRWDSSAGQQVDLIDLSGIETDTLALSRTGTIFAGDDTGRISVIDGANRRTYSAHAAGVKRVVLSDERGLLVSLSYDRTAVLWSVSEDGSLTRTAQTSLPSIVWPRSCALLGNDRIAFATFGSSYAVWNVGTGAWELESIDATASLNAVAMVGDDQFSIGDAGTLLLNGVPCAEIGSLCNFLLPFGPVLLTGGQMGVVFDARTRKVLHQHRSPLNCATAFMKDGVMHAAIGTYTGEALIFKSAPDGQALHLCDIQLHNNAIKGISADDEMLFSVCATAAAAFHRIEDFGLERYLSAAHERIANGCVRVGDAFASISRDRKLRLWRKEASEVYETPHTHSVKCIASSTDQSLIATGSYGGTIAIFDVPNRKWSPLLQPTASGISSLVSDSRSNGFFASSYDGRIYRITHDQQQ